MRDADEVIQLPEDAQVSQVQTLGRKTFLAAQAQAQAIALADDVALLAPLPASRGLRRLRAPLRRPLRAVRLHPPRTPSASSALPASPRSGVHAPEPPPRSALGF